MANPAHRETAEIIQFPTERFARRSGGSLFSKADIESLSLPRVEFGSGWYHDAAIEDEAPSSKH